MVLWFNALTMPDLQSTTKKRIETIVKNYIRSSPEEYELVVTAVKLHRHALNDPKFATLDGSSEHRALFEMPEALFGLLVRGLDDEDVAWFKTTQGGRWFARKFKDFALPSSI